LGFHATTLALQVGLKSNEHMELVTIGEAAQILGLKTSALRYYEERGLVTPEARRSGRRMYGREQLRRLAFIQLLQRLGVSLDAASAVRETTCGYASGVDGVNMSKSDNLPRLTLTARVEDLRRECIVCGDPFYARGGAIYCSARCKQRAYDRRQRLARTARRSPGTIRTPPTVTGSCPAASSPPRCGFTPT